MIKKLLILLLFFGFSFGQNLSVSEIVGVWKVKGVTQSYVFKSDGSGIYSVIDENEKHHYRFSWSILNSDTKSSNYIEGTLILDFGQIIKTNNDFISVKNFIYRQKETIDDVILKELDKLWIPKNDSWDGGDLLVLWDSISKFEGSSNTVQFWEQK